MACFNLVIEVLVVSRAVVVGVLIDHYLSFNLVIEVLVVSSPRPNIPICCLLLFQSRNRGSCRFKSDKPTFTWTLGGGFNLVIEVLVVSSGITVYVPIARTTGFNLVIEVLVVSSHRR